MTISPNAGKNEQGRPCHPNIVAVGFPNRGQLILQREIYMYPLMVNSLMGRGKGSYQDVTESLTMEMLEESFASHDATILRSAAFLAGRCQPDESELQARLTQLLLDFLESLPVDNLDIMDAGYIEAAMSLALRGEPDVAHRALTPLVTDYAATTTESYLAAFYLAQLGDPSGYPAILDALRSTNEHTRLMAVRRLIGFKPYDGQTVQGKVVDIRAELVERLKDHHPYVRVEVPYLLAEAGVEGLRELLLTVAEGDTDRNVQQAARDILDSIEDK
ncbi:HEAT repeat domain-containing protein [Chloroflexota bacterium]